MCILLLFIIIISFSVGAQVPPSSNPFIPHVMGNSSHSSTLVVKAIVYGSLKSAVLLARGNQISIVGVGDNAFGCTIVAIKRWSVVVRKNNCSVCYGVGDTIL